ncbi:MAG: PqqD family protein [Bacteroidales bacterium]|nr:PqqD family protein [Bacteroidales bacterium]
MKIVEGFRLRNIGQEHIVTGEGLAQINFNKMISLNDSAAFLWERIEGRDFSVQDLADALVEEYEIDAETALRDSEAIARKWIEAGIVAE